MNPRIEMMVQSREIEAHPAPDREVAARWNDAVQSYTDSRKGLAPKSALTLCYQAGLQGATAVLRCAGYRVRSSATGHHRLLFEALRALEIEDLSPLGREMNDLRRRRHHAVYEWDDDEESAAGMDPERLEEIVGRLLARAHGWLREQRPPIARDVAAPPA